MSDYRQQRAAELYREYLDALHYHALPFVRAMSALPPGIITMIGDGPPQVEESPEQAALKAQYKAIAEQMAADYARQVAALGWLIPQ